MSALPAISYLLATRDGEAAMSRTEQRAISNARPTPAQDVASVSALDRAISRVLAEVQDGLRHGHFEFKLTCEVIGQERRRLTLHAGKSYQFVLPKEHCVRRAVRTLDSCDGSESDSS